jgi:hypothetical protein
MIKANNVNMVHARSIARVDDEREKGEEEKDREDEPRDINMPLCLYDRLIDDL